MLERHFSFRETLGQVQVSYRSISHPQLPELPHVIRAHSPHTMWRFTVVSEEPERDPRLDKDVSGGETEEVVRMFSQRLSLLHVLKRQLRRLRDSLSRIWRATFRDRTSSKHSLPLATHTSSCNKQRRSGQRTLVEMESTVDSKGSIPVWFLNYMQR